MPYTAPSQSSPLADGLQNSTTALQPAAQPSEPVNAVPGRPRLPFSYSSTTYVRRHRRSPSVSKAVILPAVEASSLEVSRIHDVDPRSSVRQSPPPLTDATIPPGAVISPPESVANSSDDEEGEQKKKTTTMMKPSLDGLEEAIKSIQKEREISPADSTRIEQNGDSSGDVSPSTATPPQIPLRAPLSREAKKISHSRSSTETSIVVPGLPLSSSDDSDQENELQGAPPMVRKKSGELVRPALRPASAKRRPSSMPGTPTFAKAVHFDAQLEHIRHFLQLDRPLAVSAETSPTEDYEDDAEYPFGSGPRGPEFEWELRLPNFPRDPPARLHQVVRLERLFMSSDNKNLVGVVAVANLAFQKLVVARFTLDYWRTISEVTAEYNHDVRRKQAHDGYDRFNFSIKLADQANLESKTMFICVRYNIQGQEYWDNNSNLNYQVDFIKKPKAGIEKHSVPGVGPRHALPRSRNPSAPSVPRPRSMPPYFGDLVSAMDDYDPFRRPDTTAKRTDSSLRLSSSPPRDLISDPPPPRKSSSSRQAFGNRYDFGVSLSAAMQRKDTAQDRTVLSARARLDSASRQNERAKEESGPLTGKATPPTGLARNSAHSEFLKPSSIVSSKPHHESTTYRELVDKYCFYGSPKSPFSRSKRTETPSWEFAADGASGGSTASSSSSPRPSGYGEKSDSTVASSSTPRSQSPSAARSSSHASTPLKFSFPYQSLQTNIFSESSAPTAIHG
ncbi:CAZyme family CBM21 [Paecilomyces variotii]|nr:CAZyme family CBM21 [Paecilomyces variotii]KAJ9241528.1 CAZyme family CBM21 [Paecilomyces variotii]KAJ9261934.1 CAZyme family CBM21 [Paecilomyces variotii]KAJ9300385.1 CAZyme family CBM21 [Paecilomyces variotii]KAJ9374755.1 CAZyme family CBM21 [Paecilomyces variotii]